MGLIDVIGTGSVAVDTAIFIYLLEEHRDYLSVVRPLFVSAARGDLELVTSGITLLEVLVVPYRARDLALAARYESLLAGSRGVRLIDADRTQLRTAAQLRALYRIRTPDALQLAAALTARCAVFVTNDRDFPDVPELNIIQLSQFL